MSSPSLSSAVTSSTMPANSSHTPSTGGYVPMLSESNYQKWQWAIKAYLSPHDHVRVIKRVRTAAGLVDPTPPTDASELEKWLQSECMALGIIAGTIIDRQVQGLHCCAGFLAGAGCTLQ